METRDEGEEVNAVRGLQSLILFIVFIDKRLTRTRMNIMSWVFSALRVSWAVFWAVFCWFQNKLTK